MKASRLGVRWLGAAIMVATVTLAAGPPEEAGPQKIGYISPEIPKVVFPELKGEWQEGLVPDTLPIQERTVKEKMWGVDFNLVVKGNSVVFIDPPGKYYPFYQRDHYRRDRVRWVKRRQFVAAAPPLNWPY